MEINGRPSTVVSFCLCHYYWESKSQRRIDSSLGDYCELPLVGIMSWARLVPPISERFAVVIAWLGWFRCTYRRQSESRGNEFKQTLESSKYNKARPSLNHFRSGDVLFISNLSRPVYPTAHTLLSISIFINSCSVIDKEQHGAIHNVIKAINYRC